MDLTQLANLGEFIGGVAVLVTLVYLAVQVRHGNEFARDEASKTWTEFNFDLAGHVAHNRALAETWARGQDQFSELDAVDQQRMVLFEWRALDAWHHAFHQRKRGLLPDHQWNKLLWNFERFGQRESVQEAWRIFRDSYDPEFQELIDRRFAAR